MIWSPIQAYRHAYKNNKLAFPKDTMISEHFSWNEVFMNQQNEEVPSVIIFFNALVAAQRLEVYRKKSGRPIRIHRWYSSPRYNKEVVYKNAKNPDGTDKGSLSVHTMGGAIDWDEEGKNSQQSRHDVLACGLKLRLEDGTEGWVHTDTGHPYITGGMNYGLFKA